MRGTFDHFVGEMHDGGGAAVVPDERVDGDGGEVERKFLHVADVCGPKRIDGLCVIAHDENVLVCGAQVADKFSLETCRVLVFVDQNGAVAMRQAGGIVGVFREYPMNEEEEIVVIESLLGPFGIAKEAMQGFDRCGVGAVVGKMLFDRLLDRGHAVGGVPIDRLESAFGGESFDAGEPLFAG